MPPIEIFSTELQFDEKIKELWTEAFDDDHETEEKYLLCTNDRYTVHESTLAELTSLF